MKYAVIILFSILISGCQDITYKEYEEYQKICRDHDMKPVDTVSASGTYERVISVSCLDSNGVRWKISQFKQEG